MKEGSDADNASASRRTLALRQMFFYFLLAAGGAAAVWFGVSLFRLHFQGLPKPRKLAHPLLPVWEKEILLLARRRRGRLTLEEIVTETSLTVRQAEETLDSLMKLNFADLTVTEDGAKVYVFAAFKDS